MVAPDGIKKIQETGSAPFLSILADVARILRLLEISGKVKLHDFLVAPDRFVGVGNIGKHRITGRLLLLLGLGKGVIGACDLALIAIEDGQLKIDEDGSGVLPRDMGEVVSAVYIHFSIRLSQE